MSTLTNWLNEVRRIGEEERWCFYPEDWIPFFSLGVSPQDAVDYKLRGIALKLKPHEQSFAA